MKSKRSCRRLRAGSWHPLSIAACLAAALLAPAPVTRGDDLVDAFNKLLGNKPQRSARERPAPPARNEPQPIPQTSRAQVDLLGVKLGGTPEEASQALEGQQERYAVRPFRTRYVGFAERGELMEAIEAEKVRGAAAADAKPWEKPDRSVTDAANNADVVTVYFTEPPDAVKVFSVMRNAQFRPGTGVTREQLVAALEKKYGPGFKEGPLAAPVGGSKNRFATTGASIRWAWDADGKPVALKAGHHCVRDLPAILVPRGAMGLNGVREELHRSMRAPMWNSGNVFQHAEQMLHGGCVALLNARIVWDGDGLVTQLNEHAFDGFTLYTSATMTQKASVEQAAQRKEDVSSKAKTRQGPSL